MKGIVKGDLIESTKYSVIEEYSLSDIELYKDHRRMTVFYHKGFECSNPLCNRVGTRLIHGLDNGGGLHIDVYTDDLVLMTVDHLLPKSLGGGEELKNKTPMCQPCNSRKGNKFKGVKGFTHLSKKAKVA